MDLNFSTDQTKFIELSDKIKELVANLEHMGNELPKGWVNVRKRLKDLPDNNISYSYFEKICSEEGMNKADSQSSVCGYLHSLGIVLRYNETALADTVFLKPQWLTDAVYAILSHKHLEKTNGYFTKNWLFKEWGDNYTFEEKNKILLLMQKNKFDICYSLEKADEETYIVPNALKNKAPKEANEWNRKKTLSFRYRYQFMPEGIVARIIVRLNNWIKTDDNGNDLVWKKGCILSKNNCTALIKNDISNDGLTIVDISVGGDSFYRKEFLSYIRGVIDELHKEASENFNPEPLIPCNCDICSNEEEPTFFEYTELKDYIEAGEETINCRKRKPFKKPKISELLGEIVVYKPEQAKGKYEKEPFDIYNPEEINKKLVEQNDKLIGLIHEIAKTKQQPSINITNSEKVQIANNAENTEQRTNQ